jgi:hypothetical protein
MNTRTTTLAVAAAVALAALTTSGQAQVVGVPLGGVIYTPSYAIYPPPGCYVRRQQFDDVYGWRVRDVLVCPPSQAASGQ